MGRRSRQDAEETRERIYEFVRRRVLEGWPPTVREVQMAVGYRAVQSANSHLRALVEQGRLVKLAGKARGYALPDSPRGIQPSILVPLVGRVQAGALTLAVEDPEGYVPVEMRRSLTKARIEALIALRVRGDSMTGAGIQDGDLVIVQRQSTAHDGDIVVALVDDEATVKRLRIKKASVELQAENPAYAPIAVRPDRVVLVGKVIEVRRYLDDFRKLPSRR